MERPRFTPPRSHVETGFWQIAADIACQQEIKLNAIELFDKGLLEGDPDLQNIAIENTIGKADWRWPWFDEWEVRFKSGGQWPYMWVALGLDIPKPMMPSSIEEASAFLLVTQMRSLLKENGVSPIPRRRNDIETAFAKQITFSQAEGELKKRLESLLDEYVQRRNRSLCQLLAHTISHRIYAIGREERYIQLQGDGLLQWSKELSFIDCAVEQETASSLGEKAFEQLTPFFPGDRTMVSSRHDRKQ